LAGQGLSAKKIAELMEIPQEVAAEAVKRPLFLPERGWTAETLQAVRWYHAFAGSGASHRRNVLMARNPYDIPLVQLHLEFNQVMKRFEFLNRHGKELARKYQSLQFDRNVLKEAHPGRDAPKEELDEYKVQMKDCLVSLIATKKSIEKWNGDISKIKIEVTELVKKLGSTYELYNEYFKKEGDEHYQSYRDLPEEVDAWAVGGLAGELSSRLIGDMQSLLELFNPSDATGVGNNCLLDSLDQLQRGTPGTDMTAVGILRGNLSALFPELAGEMLDIYGQEGSLLAQEMGIRIRVVQVQGGRLRAHRVLIGSTGPTVHILHNQNHFMPLFLKGGVSDGDVVKRFR
jgi:hypothetical protein